MKVYFSLISYNFLYELLEVKNTSKILKVFIIFLFFSIQSIAQVSPCNLLCNTDFDDQSLAVPNGNFYVFESGFNCWKTTAIDDLFEVWGSGFEGVPSYSGIQFIEINANVDATLFQEFVASLGSTVQISFAHRGRLGTDVLSVEIGPIGGPYANLGNFSAGNSAWNYNTITYTFPTTGPTNYEVRFNSVSTTGGSGLGNFLDAISIVLPQPTFDLILENPSCPGKSNGTITVDNLSGAAPYTYSWSPPILTTDSLATGLSSGIYIVTVTDLYGCEESLAVTLSPDGVEPIVNVTEVLCPSEVYIRPSGVPVTMPGVYIDTLVGSFCNTTKKKINIGILP